MPQRHAGGRAYSRLKPFTTTTLQPFIGHAGFSPPHHRSTHQQRHEVVDDLVEFLIDALPGDEGHHFPEHAHASVHVHQRETPAGRNLRGMDAWMKSPA